MSGTRVRSAIALLLMVGAFVGAQAWRPTQRLADQRPKVELESLFPRAFGGWTMDTRMPVQLVSPDQQAMLDKIYNQTLSRTYVDRSGQRMMLSVAYGGDQSDGTRAHRPEACYPAQGFQIVSSQAGLARSGGRTWPVRRLVAKLGGRVEPITYWMMVGDQVALSGTEVKLAQLKFSVRGVIPDGVLIRVSSIDHDASQAYAQQERFIADLVSALPPPQRAIVTPGG